MRVSPLDATRLVRATAASDKLGGVSFGHFGAFFRRRWRENDYLWGRLDGAAHLIGILLGKEHPDYRGTCLDAFRAILDEDEGALPHVRERVQAIRAELSG